MLTIDGFPVNYFRDLKTLDIGDEIIYRYNGQKRIYVVTITTIICETDWSYLQDVGDNRITLITCVEYEPRLRRVVQGVQKSV